MSESPETTTPLSDLLQAAQDVVVQRGRYYDRTTGEEDPHLSVVPRSALRHLDVALVAARATVPAGPEYVTCPNGCGFAVEAGEGEDMRRHLYDCGDEDPLWPEGLPAHVQHPKTAAGRRLLGKNMRSGDAALVEWLANDIWAIETEAALSAVSVPTPPLDVGRLAAIVSDSLAATTEGTDWAEAPEPSDEPGSPYVLRLTNEIALRLAPYRRSRPMSDPLREAAQAFLDALAEPGYSLVIEGQAARAEGRPNREVERIARIGIAEAALRAALSTGAPDTEAPA